MADPYALLTETLAAAFAAATGEQIDPAIRRSDHSDYQADGALRAAKRLERKPRDLAGEVSEALTLDGVLTETSIAGPGFINLTVNDALIGQLLEAMHGDPRLDVPRDPTPQTVVVDYSAPNVAKEMHVGHLRSTIIGDAVVRLLDWLGHDVIRENHIGDWGTPFGMLIEHLLDLGEDAGIAELTVGDLDGFYKAARAKFDADDGFKTKARERVVALQGGDAETLRLWKILIEGSERYFLDVYARLGVRLGPEDFMGESAYNDELESVIEELTAKGLLVTSEGALVLFPTGFTGRDGNPLPLIVRKTDGGYGYATTDLATVRDRVRRIGATRMLYVVGAPQSQHLEMVFEASRMAGWIDESCDVRHVPFGSVLGPDGKPLKTREGQSVKLAALLDEAVEAGERALAARGLPADEAPVIGIGAVKYADLSTDRVRDYKFDLDRMVAFEGNTAPYLQYAVARIESILRKAGEFSFTPGQIGFVEPVERRLALDLLDFQSVIALAAAEIEMHKLANYLHRLAATFSEFYEACPVLKAEGDTLSVRLLLCALTARVIRQGLDLLGIAVPSAM